MTQVRRCEEWLSCGLVRFLGHRLVPSDPAPGLFLMCLGTLFLLVFEYYGYSRYSLGLLGLFGRSFAFILSFRHLINSLFYL